MDFACGRLMPFLSMPISFPHVDKSLLLTADSSCLSKYLHAEVSAVVFEIHAWERGRNSGISMDVA